MPFIKITYKQGDVRPDVYAEVDARAHLTVSGVARNSDGAKLAQAHVQTIPLNNVASVSLVDEAPVETDEVAA